MTVWFGGNVLAYLLTSRGTIACRDVATGTLVQRPLLASPGDAEPMWLGDVAHALQAGFGNFLQNDAASLDFTFPDGPLVGWRAVRAVDMRTLHLSVGGNLLTAGAHNNDFELSGAQGEGQSFLAVSAADLQALREILRSNWMVGTTGAYVPATQIALAADFMLRLGSAEVDLRWNLPFHLDDFPLRLVLLREGWRIERLCLFRPLIYYGAFGSDTIFRQLALSLHSLCTTGEYDGDVAVFTDRAAAEVERLRPVGMTSLTVVPCDARDRTAYMSARYGVGDWADAWAFQPLLYVDTDILFDRDVSPMLQAIAQSDRIAAPIEPGEPLQTSPAVGASLLQRDNCSPRFALGFNSGTLGIPNLKQHVGTLRTIARVIANHCAMYGRDAMPYVDQEIANYVSYRIGHVDTALITPYVRLAHPFVEPSARRGLVHYCWVLGGDYRVEVMRTYLERMGVTDIPADPFADQAAATSAASAAVPLAPVVSETQVHDALVFANPHTGGTTIIDLLSIGRPLYPS